MGRLLCSITGLPVCVLDCSSVAAQSDLTISVILFSSANQHRSLGQRISQCLYYFVPLDSKMNNQLENDQISVFTVRMDTELTSKLLLSLIAVGDPLFSSFMFSFNEDVFS